ncbi:hypothetical protein DPSP01_012618 [Paraphaeosphaeria sporulosa]
MASTTYAERRAPAADASLEAGAIRRLPRDLRENKHRSLIRRAAWTDVQETPHDARQGPSGLADPAPAGPPIQASRRPSSEAGPARSLCSVSSALGVVCALLVAIYLLSPWLAATPDVHAGTDASPASEHPPSPPFFCPDGGALCDPPRFFTYTQQSITRCADRLTEEKPDHRGKLVPTMLANVTTPDFVQYNETKRALYKSMILGSKTMVLSLAGEMQTLRQTMVTKEALHMRLALENITSCAVSAAATNPAITFIRSFAFVRRWEQPATSHAEVGSCEAEVLTQFLAAVDETYAEYLGSLVPLATQLDEAMSLFQLGVQGMYKLILVAWGADVDMLTKWKCRFLNRGVSCQQWKTGEGPAQTMFTMLYSADVTLMIGRVEATTRPIVVDKENLIKYMEAKHGVPAALERKKQAYKAFREGPDAARLEVGRIGNVIMTGQHVGEEFRWEDESDNQRGSS